MKRRTRDQNMMAEINITPFTDVVLVLLIIFMVATPLIYQDKIKINLPQAKTEKNQEKPLKITVGVTEQGDIYIENIKYNVISDVEKIKSKILSTVGNGADSTVVINGDKDCKYEFIMQLIDVTKEIGVKRVMLGTDAKK